MILKILEIFSNDFHSKNLINLEVYKTLVLFSAVIWGEFEHINLKIY